MRSGIIAAAFAATVLAVPLQERAVEYETDVDWVYVTDYVTVTADGPAPAPTQEAAPTKNINYHWGHQNKPHWWTGPHTQPGKQPTQAPQPAPEPSPSPSPEPEPAPTTTGWGSAPTSAPPSQPPSQPPASGDYQGLVLYHHNAHRDNHTAPHVTWSSSLASTAQKIANTCIYAHNVDMDGGGYGQNIAAGVAGSGIGRVISDMFYNGEVTAYEIASDDYQSNSPGNFEAWGHMSQMVWANTQQVACYTADCSSKGLQNTGGNVPAYFTVCNYSPPGNVANNYKNNVHKSQHEATVFG